MDFVVSHNYFSVRHFFACLTSILVLSLCTDVGAQKNALLIQMDNDYLTDRYYTAGLKMTYFRTMKQPSTQWFLEYGFQIYTPSIYDQESFDLMTQDRPFAAGHSLRGGIRKTTSDQKMHDIGVEVGFVGPSARGWEIQEYFHSAFGFKPEIIGWENQIVNQWIVNLDYKRIQEWRFHESVAISTDTHFDIGLARNSLRQGVNLRLGDFKSLNKSSWLSPKRSSQNVDFKRESFLKVGLGLNYVASNIFLQGSLFETKSPFTVDPKSIFLDGSFGFYIGNPKTNFAFEGIFQSSEVKDGKGHFYIAFIIGKVF